VTAAKPSLALLRELSDETVLRALMANPRLTRAELAVVTGLSKPTVGEAIRRLEAAGLVRDTGERTSGRGGVGTYYALAEAVGLALAVSIAPEGVTVEVLDAAGTSLERVVEPVHRPATPERASEALAYAARQALGERRARVAAVSAADPVDKATGDLVHLPDAPFLLGAMSPAAILAPLVIGAVAVDNDVNWAARAERAARAGMGFDGPGFDGPGSEDTGFEGSDSEGTADDFVYLYLGEGIGCAIVTDGEVRRGHRGLAGEIAHVPVPGPDGLAVPLTAVFGRLGLRHPASTAIDVDRLLAALAAEDGPALSRNLANAIGGALDAAIAFADPAFVVLGGPWGSAAPFVAELESVLAARPRSIRLTRPRVRAEPPLSGARAAALHALRNDVIARSR
jgi:predicted NBD/HSP70 family sugar kinase